MVRRAAPSSSAAWGLLLAAAWLQACGGDQVDAPPVELEVPLERATLSNGLELCVVPNQTVPLVTGLVAVRAGAFAEDTSVNGYSHLFEHMIFDGSENVPDPVAFRARLQALGVEDNATTNVDQVKYFFTADTTAFADATELFADALQKPALLDSQLEREKRVVLGEFDLNETDFDFLRYRRMLEELFGDYVSRVEPLGSRQVVAETTSAELHEAHDTYYVPNNSLLVLSGDITMKNARALAESAFGGWARAADPIAEHPPPKPHALARSRYVVLEAPISDTRISIGWVCPGAGDDERGAIAGQLLARVTNQSDHGFRELVAPDRATDALFSFVPNRYASYVVVGITVAQGREGAVLSIAKHALGRIAAPGDVTRAQLGQAKDDLWSSYFYSSDDPESVPHSIAARWAIDDVESFASYSRDVYAIEPGDLDRFAGGCVRGRPRAVVLQSSAGNLTRSGIDPGYLESHL